ncbi:MAG: TetR/AcrR family transcriptional regulator [Ruminococcaceae bacterium]|nr:TetR/AcrR family transcriptional regulator [Oscillospiraceae bacterium]
MDRRQRKSREAIFKAFIELLSEKNVNHITVGEIIERADIGRATFYAHFETKDFLLKALCRELFCHIFDSADGNENNHKHIFNCNAPDSVFLHLFQHLSNNDNHILDLLACQNNELFLRYFKEELIKLMEGFPQLLQSEHSAELPTSFWLNHLASTLVETVHWWIENKRKESPEEITKFFYSAIGIKG